MNNELIIKENKTPGRKTKYNKKLAEDICKDLAEGQSIRQVLKKEGRPCWQTLRNWIHKHPEFKEEYLKAKADGIEFTINNAENLLNESLEASKSQTKTDLGKTHLIKAALDFAKWKAEKLSPKVYGKQSELNVKTGDNLIQVKWSE